MSGASVTEVAPPGATTTPSPRMTSTCPRRSTTFFRDRDDGKDGASIAHPHSLLARTSRLDGSNSLGAPDDTFTLATPLGPGECTSFQGANSNGAKFSLSRATIIVSAKSLRIFDAHGTTTNGLPADEARASTYRVDGTSLRRDHQCGAADGNETIPFTATPTTLTLRVAPERIAAFRRDRIGGL